MIVRVIVSAFGEEADCYFSETPDTKQRAQV